jgi:hypothetical protein
MKPLSLIAKRRSDSTFGTSCVGVDIFILMKSIIAQTSIFFVCFDLRLHQSAQVLGDGLCVGGAKPA